MSSGKLKASDFVIRKNKSMIRILKDINGMIDFFF